MPGSGKSILSNEAKKLGIPVIVMGDMVREEVRTLGLPLTSENLMKTAEELRRKLGRGAVAHLVLKKIRETKSLSNAPIIVIEGLRSPEEKDLFAQFFDKFYLVAIHASPKTRYKRILVNRKRKDDFKSIEELKNRDLRELHFGIGELLALADIHLVNENKSLEEFSRECHELLVKLKEKKLASDP